MFDVFILILEIIGTIAFAISGAMTAMERKLDVLGVTILGVVTACGGGFIRDVCLGKVPENIFVNPMYVIISFVTALILFIIFYIKKDISIKDNDVYKNVLTITDALGLGIFVVIGATETINMGYSSFFIITFMATITAVGGGIIRDICVNKIPNVFRKHLYAVPTILGAMIYFGFYKLNLSNYASILITIVFISVFRMLAYKFELSLPRVKFKDEIDKK